MLVNVFPKLSETFILGQMTGLIEAGHDLDIYALNGGTEERVHEDVLRYGLLARAFYLEPSERNIVRRMASIASLVATRRSWHKPALIPRVLDIRKLGSGTGSRRFVYGSLVFRQQAPYDIVHAQFGTVGLLALRLKETGAMDEATPLVVSFRGWDLTCFAHRHPGIYSDLFRKALRFLPVCDAFRKQLIECGCEENKITVHYSGIDLSKFNLKESSDNLAIGRTVTLLSVGRLVEKKGIEYAIRAVAELLKTGYRVSYTVVGDGELMAALKNLVDVLGVGSHVRFVGAKGHEEVLALIQSHHIMLAPSVTGKDKDQEGIPNVLKEAMAMGVPVVSTLHSGIPELVQDGVSGFLVRERDVSGMAERLAYLIDHRELWPVMGRAGRVQIEKYFNSAQLNNRLIEIYRGTIAGGKE